LELPLLPLPLLGSVRLFSLLFFALPINKTHFFCFVFNFVGYTLRHLHDTKVDQRLQSIENAVCTYISLILLLFLLSFASSLYHVFCQVKGNSNLQHTDIKDIVAGSGGYSLPACVATAGTSLVIGFVHSLPHSQTLSCSLTRLC